MSKKDCSTCEWATITIIAECDKKIDGEYVHFGGYCPDEFTCEYWEQADEFTIEMNSFDWSKAKNIRVD